LTNDELLLPIPKELAQFIHYVLHKMLGVFGLCVLAEMSVAPTNRSPQVPPVITIPLMVQTRPIRVGIISWSAIHIEGVVS
jgi:hypothetical protein